MTDIYKGHKSFAEMVSTHISVWRDLIKENIEKSEPAYGDFHDDDRGYWEHELKALEEINEACKHEMQNEH